MTLVIDAGVVVAALADDGAQGRWAESMLGSAPLAAPHVMPVEAANIVRRACLAGTLDTATAYSRSRRNSRQQGIQGSDWRSALA